MTTRQDFAAMLTVMGDRYSSISNEIGREEYPPDLDQRLTKLADDLANALSDCGELTDKRKFRLAALSEELQVARELLKRRKDFRVMQAFQRATHCINDVAVDVTHGPMDG